MIDLADLADPALIARGLQRADGTITAQGEALLDELLARQPLPRRRRAPVSAAGNPTDYRPGHIRDGHGPLLIDGPTARERLARKAEDEPERARGVFRHGNGWRGQVGVWGRPIRTLYTPTFPTVEEARAAREALLQEVRRKEVLACS